MDMNMNEEISPPNDLENSFLPSNNQRISMESRGNMSQSPSFEDLEEKDLYFISFHFIFFVLLVIGQVSSFLPSFLSPSLPPSSLKSKKLTDQ
jgi:hypothetical protein